MAVFQDYPASIRILSPRVEILAGDVATSLDGVNTTGLADGTLCTVQENGAIYLLAKESVAAASPPDIVAPLTGPGRWFLGGQSGGGSNLFEADAVNNVIRPVDAQIGRGFVVGSDGTESGGSGDSRMFFEKVDGSFRAGAATGAQWDAASRGAYSAATGYNTTASGANSHAEGYVTVASGPLGSHAEGYNTTASGIASHAEGYGSTASGDFASHAEGYYTTAAGDASHAEGYGSSAPGDGSHAEGYYTTASGDPSHAEGYQTAATNDNAHAEGSYTTASGPFSHAEGRDSVASGDEAHAEGLETVASGDDGSHAEGYGGIASGLSSHAEGRFSVAFLQGMNAHSSDAIAAFGDNQNSKYTMQASTTDATQTTMTIDTVGALGAIPLNKSWTFKIVATARQVAGVAGVVGDTAGFDAEGVIKNIAGAATMIAAATVNQIAADDATWALAVDATGATLRLQVTGAVDRTIRWGATVRLHEIL